MSGRMLEVMIAKRPVLLALGLLIWLIGTAAAAPPPSSSGDGSPWVFELTIAGLAGHQLAVDYSEPFDPDLPPSERRATAVAIGGNLELALGKTLGSPEVALLVFGRIGWLSMLESASEERDDGAVPTAGLKLIYELPALGGTSFSLSGGVGWFRTVGLGVSFPFSLSREWSLGVGVEATGLWRSESTLGDHGEYTDDIRVLGGCFVVTLRHKHRK